MELSAVNRVKVFEVIGLPPEGSNQTVVTTLAHMPVSQLGLWEPTYTNSNISNIRTSIDANLTAISAETQARIELYLTEWDQIAISELTVMEADNGVKGNIVSDEQRRELIRQRVGNLVGIWVPKGGWMQEIGRLFTPTGYPHNGGGGGRY